jgi:copper transport protein
VGAAAVELDGGTGFVLPHDRRPVPRLGSWSVLLWVPVAAVRRSTGSVDNRGVRRARRAVVALSVAGLVLSGQIGSRDEARAHSVLIDTDPSDGATLQTSPEAVTLRFTEEPEPTLARVVLVDQTGRVIPGTRVIAVPEDPRSILIMTGELPEGAYTLIWRMVSRIDGHATAGLLTFGVGVPPLRAPPGQARTVAEPPFSPLEVGGRWSFLVGLFLLVGSITTGTPRSRSVPRVVRQTMAVGLIVAIAGLAALAAAQRSVARVPLADLLNTATGRSVLWRGIGMVVAAIGVVAYTAASHRTLGLLGVGSGAGGAILAEAASGHAGGGTSAWVEIAAQWCHMAAAGVWIGGLAALLLRVRSAQDDEKAQLVRRFSRMAGVALLVVVATGTIRAVGELDRPNDLFDTWYGRVLVGKIGALVGLVALGAVNRYRNVPRVPQRIDGLQRVSRAELALAAGVLVASSVLSGIAPPSTPAPVRAASADLPSLELESAGSGDPIRAHLSISPGEAGVNRFDARITRYDTERPVRAAAVTLRFRYRGATETGGTELELIPQEPGTYSAIGPNLALEGFWHLVLTVQGSGAPTEVTFDLATRCRAVPLGIGQPQIYSLPLDGHGSVQGLLGSIGGARYQVHYTFLDESERELVVGELATVVAWRAGSRPVELQVDRLGRGHFVGRGLLDAGRWYFEASAAGPDGTPLRGCFEEQIGTAHASDRSDASV